MFHPSPNARRGEPLFALRRHHLVPNARRGEPLFARWRLRPSPMLKRQRRGQSTVEYALICVFLLVVISATILRFASLPADLGELLVHQLVFQLGQHWHGVLTFF